jgi:leader peptidase (prepilin peptidase)/N-methyltransferase
MRDLIFIGFAFALGAAIGSFLNVVIYRLPLRDEGLSLTEPRYSRCPNCGASIRWHDNIPLLSYFALGARCRACKAPISIRYFCVELLTAVVFAALAVHHLVPHTTIGGAAPANPPGASLALFGVHGVLLAALIAVTFIDIDFEIIPDRIDIPGIILAPLISFLVPALHSGADFEAIRGLSGLLGFDLPQGLGLASPRVQALVASVLGIAVGAGVIWIVGVLGELAFRKEAMGFGDVKLLGMVGGYVGFTGALLTLLVASLTGAIVGIVIKLATGERYIPFGPFLSIGAALILVFRPQVVHAVFELYPRAVR